MEKIVADTMNIPKKIMKIIGIRMASEKAAKEKIEREVLGVMNENIKRTKRWCEEQVRGMEHQFGKKE